MKIGILIDRLNVGGVEKIAIEQVKSLRSINVDAHLVVLKRKAVVENAFQELRKDLPTIYLDDRLPKFLKNNFKFPVFSFFSFFHLTYPFLIPFVVRSHEFDYLFSHGTYTSFTAIGIKKTKNISFSAFIWDPIGYIIQRVYKGNFPGIILSLLQVFSKFLDKLIISNSNVILVGGKAHNKYFKQLVSKKNIVVIPPSTHPLTYIPQKKEKYILMITAWKKGKDPEYIEEICKRIASLKIKMAGKWLDPAYLKEFEQFIKDKHIEGNIQILGAVSEEQLSALYKNACVLLQTNDDKGFGMPALEAAGHGTTFIIPQGQGVCELFEEGKEGFFTKERDTTTIVKYLKILMDSESKAKSMGESAWKKVKENYNWKKHAYMLEKVAVKYGK